MKPLQFWGVYNISSEQQEYEKEEFYIKCCITVKKMEVLER